MRGIGGMEGRERQKARKGKEGGNEVEKKVAEYYAKETKRVAARAQYAAQEIRYGPKLL